VSINTCIPPTGVERAVPGQPLIDAYADALARRQLDLERQEKPRLVREKEALGGGRKVLIGLQAVTGRGT